MKYRKKPIVVEAIKYLGDGKTCSVPMWFIEAQQKKVVYFDSNGECFIETLEGQHHVSDGDYIIRGVKGEIYPCKPDIFKQTYERA